MSDDRSVSIVIPAWNADEALCRAIDSVLSQQEADAQIVVVEDGSANPSNSLLLSTYPELLDRPDSRVLPRIDYIAQPNQGAYRARLNGVQLCSRPFLKFLDQDDVLLPDTLAVELEAFDKNIDAVLSNWLVQQDDGDDELMIAPTLKDPVSDFLRYGGCHTSGVVYRTTFAKTALVPVETFTPVKADDWLIFAQAVVAGARYRTVDLTSARWQRTKNQLSERTRELLIEEHFRILDWIENALESRLMLTPERKELLADYYAKQLIEACLTGPHELDRLIEKIRSLNPGYRQQHGNKIYRMLCDRLGLMRGVKTWCTMKRILGARA